MTMLPRPAARLALLAGLSLLSACGLAHTNASTNHQTLTVKSEPAGAECSLQRNGEALATFATPHQLTVSQSRRDIAAVCRLPGYQDTPATLESTMIPITPLHLMAMGTAGVMAHTAAGNFNRYPEETTVALLPLAFPNAAARDGFLAARKAELALRATAAERRIAKSCTTPDFCRMERENAEADQQTRLAALETQVASVPVQ
ncbi:hypothetical protein BKE38_26425 [Pseudoroseomonas deserti]|uniref:PEGA domain-containing protein n=1 Tax=Teichococcus deserti TaxID=1817963 RepID=A0A1V2GV65_9PROT|nr:hypothetical protein [Pseudoroseomonas deserti]ONG45566.1 hypothetical protein BKE38_26425 [Pseudoroseomonas deserti]